MICRKIVKTALTNVDVVGSPANQYSTFVMAKSADEKPKGIVARAIDAIAGFFKGDGQSQEMQSESAEAGFYDLTLAFRDTVADIVGTDATDNEKQADIAKAANEYALVLNNYLFGGIPEDPEVVKSRSERLRLWKSGLEAALSAGQEEIVEEKVTGGAEPNGESISTELSNTEGPVSASDGSDATTVHCSAADNAAVEPKEAGGAATADPAANKDGSPDTGSVGPVGDTVTVNGDGLGTAKSAGAEEAVSGQPARAEGCVNVPNSGESIAKSALSTEAIEERLAKANLLIAELDRQISEKMDMVAKSNIKIKCDKYKTIGFNDDGAVEVLFELSKSNPDRYHSLVDRLDLLVNAFEKGNVLFEELGKSGANNKGTALAQIESMAKSIAKEKGIDLVAARGEVWSTNPQLYKQYLDEKKTGGK